MDSDPETAPKPEVMARTTVNANRPEVEAMEECRLSTGLLRTWSMSSTVVLALEELLQQQDLFFQHPPLLRLLIKELDF